MRACMRLVLVLVLVMLYGNTRGGRLWAVAYCAA